ncbi:MAG: GerMN domain-containing protein [Actinomycetes bacterium]
MRVRAATSAIVTMLAVAGLALVSCSVPSGSDARPVDSDIAALLTPSVTPTPEATARQRPSRITWVKKEKLVQRIRLIPAKTRQDRLDGALLELVVNGPSPAEQKHGLETKIPPGLSIDGTVHGSRVKLDVPNNSTFEQGGVEWAVGQLATTALSIPSVRQVVFSVDGSPTEVTVPGADKPQRVLTMRDYRKVLR